MIHTFVKWTTTTRQRTQGTKLGMVDILQEHNNDNNDNDNNNNKHNINNDDNNDNNNDGPDVRLRGVELQLRLDLRGPEIAITNIAGAGRHSIHPGGLVARHAQPAVRGRSEGGMILSVTCSTVCCSVSSYYIGMQ